MNSASIGCPPGSQGAKEKGCIQNKFSQIQRDGKKVFNTQCLMIRNDGEAVCTINAAWILRPGETYISNLQPGMWDCTQYEFSFDYTPYKKKIVDKVTGAVTYEDAIPYALLSIVFTDPINELKK